MVYNKNVLQGCSHFYLLSSCVQGIPTVFNHLHRLAGLSTRPLVCL